MDRGRGITDWTEIKRQNASRVGGRRARDSGNE